MSNGRIIRAARSRQRSDGGAIHARGTVINIKRADHSTSRQKTYADEFELSPGFEQMILPTPYIVERLFQFISQKIADKDTA